MTNEEAGEARKSVAPTTSSTVAQRPSGTWLVSHSDRAPASLANAVMSVRVHPGQSALTRTPLRAQPTARLRASDNWAAFVAAYASIIGVPTIPAIDDISTRLARSDSTRYGWAAGRRRPWR